MPLNNRQLLAYNHLVNVWRRIRGGPSALGKPAADVWSLIATNVKCHYKYTENISDPIEGGGEIKRPSLFTDDRIDFAADQDIRQGDILKNVSYTRNGAPSPLYGQMHRALGVSKVVPTSGNRQANKCSVLTQVIDKAPTGVT